MPQVLVTGGAGFIGSHLCDQFVKRGDKVICVDNFVSGRRENIQHLLDNPLFTLLEQDATLPFRQEINNLSAIFHFASPASPNPDSPVSYLAHPVETLMVNSLGTKNLLELATASGCQIVLASTSEVYGDPSVHPQPETYWGNVNPIGIRSCYDEGKRFLEALAFAYHRTRGTKIKVIRIFNTYGPRMDLSEGRFIPSLVSSVLHQTSFSRFGDGTSTRSFCYIDDLIEGILAVEQSEKMLGQVVNLGNDEEYSVNQVIAMIEEFAGKKLTLTTHSALADDPHKRRPDLTKAKKLLGFKPAVSLSAGLMRMIKWYEAN